MHSTSSTRMQGAVCSSGAKQALTNGIVHCARVPRPASLPRTSTAARQHRNKPRQATAATAAEAPSTPSSPAPTNLTSAETASTIVDITNHATLSTISEDGSPLGTYVTYILTKDGQLILRLRADAVHTANLRRDSRCSLFIHPQDLPARLLGRWVLMQSGDTPRHHALHMRHRVTLIGSIQQADEATAAMAAAAHREHFANAMGVDAPSDNDSFFRLVIDRAFYVGGMGSAARAEVLSAEQLTQCNPDELRREAPALVFSINSDRSEDVLRISSHALGVNLEQLEGAELLWVDSLGAFFCASADDTEHILRVPFPRAVHDEREARSALTMLAQVAWERERRYAPVMPVMEPPVSG